VFNYRRLKDQRLEFASFAVIGVVGVAINAAAMSIGVKFLGLHYLIAKCGAAGFTFLWNFLARRQFLFVQRRAT
jgi:putative flippase GtrA